MAWKITSVVFAGSLATMATASATAADYRGLYWYGKYFGATDVHSYRARHEREGLPREELVARAFDQGFYNAHHFHHAANRPEIYALAREADFDNEVAIVIDDRSGEVIDAVVLPH